MQVFIMKIPSLQSGVLYVNIINYIWRCENWFFRIRYASPHRVIKSVSPKCIISSHHKVYCAKGRVTVWDQTNVTMFLMFYFSISTYYSRCIYMFFVIVETHGLLCSVAYDPPPLYYLPIHLPIQPLTPLPPLPRQNYRDIIIII